MDDSNPAPRLLSRPGEAIYNDAAGTLEGNSPFQVVWLPDNERDACLERIRERAAVETNAMKDEFVATVSHELRTPLTSIYGSLRLINGGAVGELSPDVLRLTGVASRNAERLSKLVDDLLELKRIESG